MSSITAFLCFSESLGHKNLKVFQLDICSIKVKNKISLFDSKMLLRIFKLKWFVDARLFTAF